MAFSPLRLHFIRFLGPQKKPAEYTFTSGLNILWGASDTGKTFLVQAIDFMLGAGNLKDIPERAGYDRILLGISDQTGEYTIHRSIAGGGFRLFDGLVREVPEDRKVGSVLSASHNSKNYTNLSNWLLRSIGLDRREILRNGKGELRSLGFRALAHLCVIVYPKITQAASPIYHGQIIEQTPEYGVFKLLLTGSDDSAVTSETAAEIESAIPATKPSVRPEVLEEMIFGYEDELAALTTNPDGLEAEEDAIEGELEAIDARLTLMEGQISSTNQQRKRVYDRHTQLGVRRNEIVELQERFKLLDAQYTNDAKRLAAIEESGRLFVLLEPMACPLCGASPNNQDHAAACDGNVVAVSQAAAAEIAKIRVLQTELRDTVASLLNEKSDLTTERKLLETEWRGYQEQLDAGMASDFTQVRKRRDSLIEQRTKVQQALALNKRIRGIRRRLDEPSKPVAEPIAQKQIETPSLNQYISKSVLRDFSSKVGDILGAWHFPGATDVYFDEVTRDVVIGGRARGSRGAGLCAITYSAFSLALFDLCRSNKRPHPGLVILDSPLIAYKEPKADDEGIIGTDLKLKFYEHLKDFAGEDQIFIVDNTEPPVTFLKQAVQFTGNPAIPRCGLLPCLPKAQG